MGFDRVPSSGQEDGFQFFWGGGGFRFRYVTTVLQFVLFPSMVVCRGQSVNFLVLNTNNLSKKSCSLRCRPPIIVLFSSFGRKYSTEETIVRGTYIFGFVALVSVFFWRKSRLHNLSFPLSSKTYGETGLGKRERERVKDSKNVFPLLPFDNQRL